MALEKVEDQDYMEQLKSWMMCLKDSNHRELTTLEIIKILKSIPEELKREMKNNCLFCHDEYYKETIIINNNIQVVLIGWQNCQKSPVHGHNGSIGAVLIIDRQGVESFFDKPTDNDPQKVKLVGSHVIKPGSILPVSKEGIHKIEVEDGKMMISLHIYSKPISEMKIYESA